MNDPETAGDTMTDHTSRRTTGRADEIDWQAIASEKEDRLERLEQAIWRLHGLPNVREEPGGLHVNAIRYCRSCSREWPCPTVRTISESHSLTGQPTGDAS